MAVIPQPADIVETLAILLDLPLIELTRVVGHPRSGQYRTWYVPRGPSRPWRRIDAPDDGLREVQHRILRRLLVHAPVSPWAHGFVPGRSIVTNARAHLPGARVMLSVDLLDAYPSVSEARVRSALGWGLGRFLRYGQPTLPANGRRALCDLLADLCCYDGRLPQGAPTSGAILNLACRTLDRRCARLARSLRPSVAGLCYSRYADDLTFSAIAEFPEGFRERVLALVRRSGFRVNRGKVRLSDVQRAELVICGVRLHEGQLTLPRAELRRYRALFFQALAYPPDAVPQPVRDTLCGALGFLTMVTPTCPAPLERLLDALIQQHGSWLRPRGWVPRRPTLPPYG